MKNSLLLITALLVLGSLSVSCSKMHKLNYAFNPHNVVEDTTANGMYLIKNDGTKVYGNEINTTTGIIKKQIEIDDQKFKISDIKAYRVQSAYYIRFKGHYIKRIVHGKLNVYEWRVMSSNAGQLDQNGKLMMSTEGRILSRFFIQAGDEAKLVSIGGKAHLKDLVKDCPQAVEKLNISESELKKSIKSDPNHLNKIIDLYNKNCKTAP